jgi:hypothetical protein
MESSLIFIACLITVTLGILTVLYCIAWDSKPDHGAPYGKRGIGVSRTSPTRRSTMNSRTAIEQRAMIPALMKASVRASPFIHLDGHAGRVRVLPARTRSIGAAMVFQRLCDLVEVYRPVCRPPSASNRACESLRSEGSLNTVRNSSAAWLNVLIRA